MRIVDFIRIARMHVNISDGKIVYAVNILDGQGDSLFIQKKDGGSCYINLQLFGDVEGEVRHNAVAYIKHGPVSRIKLFPAKHAKIYLVSKGRFNVNRIPYDKAEEMRWLYDLS